jgi:hypothetical protein
MQNFIRDPPLNFQIAHNPNGIAVGRPASPEQMIPGRNFLFA